MEAELKWLDDPEVFRVNQLPAHSDHRFYRDQEEAALEKSYKHLCALRDEVIAMGVLPPISEWHALNPNIK